MTAAPRPAGGCGTPPGPTAPCAASARCCPAAGTQPSPAATPDTDDGERGSPSPGHCAGRCDAGREGAAPRGGVCAPTAPCAPPRSAAEARGWILDPSGERYYWWLSAMVLPVLYNWVVIICRCCFTEVQERHAALWLSLDCVGDALYLLDISVRLHTGQCPRSCACVGAGVCKEVCWCAHLCVRSHICVLTCEGADAHPCTCTAVHTRGTRLNVIHVAWRHGHCQAGERESPSKPPLRPMATHSTQHPSAPTSPPSHSTTSEPFSPFSHNHPCGQLFPLLFLLEGGV